MKNIVLVSRKNLYSMIRKTQPMIGKKRCKIYLIGRDKIVVDIFYLLECLLVNS